jgi:uncharacterized protein (DUF2236 family)
VSDAGLFGPRSVTWRINGETAMMLGGGRALILQVAHPLIGAGVDRYSRYKADRWRRLTHTLDTMGQILFGDTETALEAARRMRLAHERIQGMVAEGRAAGQAYQASDPSLILWVWATLVDTSIAVYDRYVASLSTDEIETYYEEQKRFAHVCGVPESVCPATYAAFGRYWSEITSRTLEATPAAREIVRLVLNPLDLPRVAAPLLQLVSVSTAGLLPVRLRDELDIGWGPRHERVLRATAATCRAARPIVPDRLGRVRSARRAAERIG